jgi:uncharacterized protein (TIGR00369 family)
MLDTVMGAALQTRLPPGSHFATVDLKITYLRPLTAASGVIRATGRVVNSGRRLAYIEGEVRDGAGALAVHAVGNFIVKAPSGRGDRELERSPATPAP